MKVVSTKVISQELIDEIWDIYKNTTNTVEVDGYSVDRHKSGQLGAFLLSEYTKEEFKNIWPPVKKSLIEIINCDVELVYCRILKYGINGYITKHVDGYSEQSQQENNLSVIIQLSDPNNYKGGDLIISKELLNLQSGDMLVYTYEHEHEVKRVKEGIRYVINLRCKMVK
jgi:hypothetical protein